MLFCCHRINTIIELQSIPIQYGIEIDVRDDQYGNIHISHDPFIQGELFDHFLQSYKHSFIILNIKSEGIEYKVLELLKKYNIQDYFFLDSSFPMIYKLSCQGEKNIAVRFSEFEDIETILNMKDKVNWVWVDCFTKNPLHKIAYNILKNAGFKLCFVSPELQNKPEKIKEYKNYFQYENIRLDMVCSKSYNIDVWSSNNVQIIIPMSGLGKRFVDAGYNDPKPLIKVDGKPIIEHVINLFPGEKNITFICNDKHSKETNMSNILTSICPHGQIYEVPVEGRQGPVHAISLLYDKIDDDKEVIISYCDYGTYWNYEKFLFDTRSRNADGAIACYKGFHPHMLGTDNYAFLQETEQGSRWLKSIQEKQPFTNDRMSEYASNGTYYFKSGAIMKKYCKLLMQNNIKVNNEYYVSMVYNLLVQDNLRASIFEIEHMLQWGTPNDLEIYKDWSKYFLNIIKPQPKYNDNDNTLLVLPMAGAGSRFAKKNYKNPKPLIDVNGLPMIVQAVNCLPDTSEKIFICLEDHLNYYDLHTTLMNMYENSKIHTINEITQGQACTCEIGIHKSNIDMDRPILISACDNGVYYDVDKYQKMLDDKQIDVIVWTFRNNPASRNNPNMYAWLETDENDYIKTVSCKNFDTTKHDIKKSHVIIGTMFFRKTHYFTDGLHENYKENIRTNGEFYVDDVINRNIEQGLKVKAFEVENYICWGTPDDYETYKYWQTFFDKCDWHEYCYDKDITYHKPLHS
jgi:NDP-sugar pyrophosphorylase family protein